MDSLTLLALVGLGGLGQVRSRRRRAQELAEFVPTEQQLCPDCCRLMAPSAAACPHCGR